MSFASTAERVAFSSTLDDKVADAEDLITGVEAGFLLDFFDLCSKWGLCFAGLDAADEEEVPLVTLARFDAAELDKAAEITYAE